jgi:hypothetical protein
LEDSGVERIVVDLTVTCCDGVKWLSTQYNEELCVHGGEPSVSIARNFLTS